MSGSARPPERDHAGVIAPPPLIFGGVLFVALLLDWIIDAVGFGLPFYPQMVAGGVLAVAGLALIIVAAAQFRVAQTNIEPWKPTTSLITTGIYGYTRNPIYLGMAIGFVGLSLLTDSLLALLALPVALVIMHHGVILREEHYLEGKFGADYRKYRDRVRRWI